ncbi:MAG: hypothetical protein HC905_29585 [Bacteroidales bacterium]|nr:hypothetical protein [Bacteroidales bacterium]
MTVLSFIVKDLWSFFSPPIFFLMWIGFFLILANVFYTSGWIFQLLTRHSSNTFINRIKPKVFICGLLFSFGVELIPCLLAGGYSIVTGERIKSKYADFTTKEPNINDIVGDYVVAEMSKKQLNLPDSISFKTIIKFKADKTFEFKYFPNHYRSMNLSEYDIVNAKGKWDIEKDQGSWVIPMRFDTIVNLRTGHVDETGFYISNGFHINKNKPPYEIYIVIGDPDSWEGVTLQKR